MKKKIVIIIMMCVMLLNACSQSVEAVIDQNEIYSENIGVYNLDNMELLYGVNVNTKISIASITKIMTAIVAIENIDDLDAELTIDYSTIDGKVDEDLVTAGIYDGQTLTYYDLLCVMLIPSGADCAIYFENNIFDSEETFISKMNEKAKELGMTNTSFSNVTGLDDDDNYSTINDVAIMMEYALENETLKEILSMEEYTTTTEEMTVTSTIASSATRYGIDLEYIIGGKTGTTGDAGLCLASFSTDTEDDVNLLIVVTGASMYSGYAYNISDSEYLYEQIISDYSNQAIISEGEILYTLDTSCTKQDSVTIYAKDDVIAYTDEIDKDKIEIEYDGIEVLDYTIKEGETIGTISVYYGGTLVDEIEVTLDEKLNFSVIKWVKLNKEIVAIFAGVVLVIIFLILIFTRKKKKDRALF